MGLFWTWKVFEIDIIITKCIILQNKTSLEIFKTIQYVILTVVLLLSSNNHKIIRLYNNKLKTSGELSPEVFLNDFLCVSDYI